MKKHEAEAGAKTLNERIGQEVVSVYPTDGGWGVGAPMKLDEYPDSYMVFNCDLDDIKFEVHSDGKVTFTLPTTEIDDLRIL